MKKLKFILCSFLLLSFCLTVTAKQTTVEKAKIEVLQFTDVQHFAPVAVVNFDVNYFVTDNAFVIVASEKPFLPSFAVMPDVGWSFNTFVSHFSIYQDKLNSNYIADKRKEIQKTGITFNRLSC
jgi:hypothetical protein